MMVDKKLSHKLGTKTRYTHEYWLHTVVYILAGGTSGSIFELVSDCGCLVAVDDCGTGVGNWVLRCPSLIV